MSKFNIVIPLLHKECKLLPNVPLLLDEITFVRSLKSEHIGAIISKRSSLIERLNGKSKCILVQCGDTESTRSFIEGAALCGAFVLNVYAKLGALMYDQAFVVKHVRSHSVVDVIDLPTVSAATYGNYEIDPTAQPTSIRTLYAGVHAALAKDPSLSITVRRFNGALSKTTLEDKVIDIAICLESMFNSQTEISFRFSLYNTLLAEEDITKRLTLFETLKRLYRERSNLVHGSKVLNSEWVTQNWDAIIRASKLCIVRKITFLQDKDTSAWQAYLDRLALGD
jgi:hypothetical protein